jgi:hypothetical protein
LRYLQALEATHCDWHGSCALPSQFNIDAGQPDLCGPGCGATTEGAVFAMDVRSQDDRAPDDGYPMSHIGRRTVLRKLGAASLLAATFGGARSAFASDENGTTESASGGSSESDAGEMPGTTEDLYVPAVSKADLAPSETGTAGRIVQLLDSDRSIWLDTGEGWISLTGYVLDVCAFGAVGDGKTDDWTAFNAAIEAISSPLLDQSTAAFGRTLLVPSGRYRLAQTLVITRGIRLIGIGAGPSGDSILAPDAGIIGVIVEAADPLTGGPDGRTGAGAMIERLRIESVGAEGPSETERSSVANGPAGAHGVWLQTGGSIRRCAISGFSGNGIHIATPAASGQTESGTWAIEECLVERCGGDGLFAQGNQSGTCTLVEALNNGGWGVRDESTYGNSYVQCRAADNGDGSFRSAGNGNRSLFLNCHSERGQQPASFTSSTIVIGGRHAARYEGGNTWTANGSRMTLLAQDPGEGESPLATAPTLAIRGQERQQQPHVQINGPDGARQFEVDPSGRVSIGPVDPDVPAGGSSEAAQTRLQVSGGPDGLAGVRWILTDEPAEGEAFVGWAAQARAFRDAPGPDAPNAPTGFASLRLTVQTPANDGTEIDTLTFRNGRVGIGTNQPAAALDVASITQGFLPPRLTSEQREAISAPAEGTLIYNLTSHRLNFYDGENWQELTVTTGG